MSSLSIVNDSFLINSGDIITIGWQGQRFLVAGARPCPLAEVLVFDETAANISAETEKQLNVLYQY
ncbi:MAG: hypothetical protein PQJ61_16880 [Spirochaetales bacterium]|uniref:Uncharacterized protein n=1 Tax=Candidatus Thalassospirochaeta sargassi TaxID=3119039 RepID=A0AAJ1MPV2_9SPIO|nr:hypothetical protein [Spirochaetales bacterium]